MNCFPVQQLLPQPFARYLDPSVWFKGKNLADEPVSFRAKRTMSKENYHQYQFPLTAEPSIKTALGCRLQKPGLISLCLCHAGIGNRSGGAA